MADQKESRSIEGNGKAVDIAVLKSEMQSIASSILTLGNNMCDVSDEMQKMTVQIAVSNKEREDLKKAVDRIETAVVDLTHKFTVKDTMSGALAEKNVDLEKRVRSLEELMPLIKIIFGVFSFFGMSLLGFLWALITGKATIIFP